MSDEPEEPDAPDEGEDDIDEPEPPEPEPEPPDPAPFGERLRIGLENATGAASEGPNARTVTYTFDGNNNFVVPYLTVIFDGFKSGEHASQNMFGFALGHVFHISGNAVTLSRSPVPDPAGQFASGSHLIWRAGHTPTFGVDSDGFWSVQMTYLLLPAFARVIG